MQRKILLMGLLALTLVLGGCIQEGTGTGSESLPPENETGAGGTPSYNGAENEPQPPPISGNVSNDLEEWPELPYCGTITYYELNANKTSLSSFYSKYPVVEKKLDCISGNMRECVGSTIGIQTTGESELSIKPEGGLCVTRYQILKWHSNNTVECNYSKELFRAIYDSFEEEAEGTGNLLVFPIRSKNTSFISHEETGTIEIENPLTDETEEVECSILRPEVEITNQEEGIGAVYGKVYYVKNKKICDPTPDNFPAIIYITEPLESGSSNFDETRVVATGLTDEEGNYKIELPYGTYSLWVGVDKSNFGFDISHWCEYNYCDCGGDDCQEGECICTAFKLREGSASYLGLPSGQKVELNVGIGIQGGESC